MAQPRGHRSLRARLHLQGDPGRRRPGGTGGASRRPLLRRAGGHHRGEHRDPRLEAVRVAHVLRGPPEFVQRRRRQGRAGPGAGALLPLHRGLRLRQPHRRRAARGEPRAGADARALVGPLAGDPVHRPGSVRDGAPDGRRLRRRGQRRPAHAASGRAGRAGLEWPRGPRLPTPRHPSGDLAGDGADPDPDHDQGRDGGHRSQRRHPRLRRGGEDRDRPEGRSGHEAVLPGPGDPFLRGLRTRRRPAHRDAGALGRAQEREMGERGGRAHLCGAGARGPAVPERVAARHAARADRPRARAGDGGARLLWASRGERAAGPRSGRAGPAHARGRLQESSQRPDDPRGAGDPGGGGRARGGGGPAAGGRRGARAGLGRPAGAGAADRRAMTRRRVAMETLLEALGMKTVLGRLPEAVTGLAYDSRAVTKGDLFVAVPGLKRDGRLYIPEALDRGAAAVVTEGEDPLAGSSHGRILVPSAREAMARLADRFFDHPSGALTVVGITGTNGKTTTSYLVEALLRGRGVRTGIVGTIQYRVGDEPVPAGQTTPEALELQGLLARMVEAGVKGVAMEVSSHALALHRVDGIDFDVAVFTNLTQDHLDFHGTLEAYRRAKRRLFELLAVSPKHDRWAVVNLDDPVGPGMVEGLPLRTLGYGLRPSARVRPLEHASTLDGIRMAVETPSGRLDVASPLIGEHNVMNLLAACAVGVALRMEPAAIGSALATVPAVPGRFERVEAGQPFLVVVDYAHTPDALERVLTTARRLTRGRLGVVFGCGGDRDRGKRPVMGEIAARIADRVWVTSDNPRSESPEAIIAEILAGVG